MSGEKLVKQISEFSGIPEEEISQKITDLSLQELTRMVSYYRNSDKEAVVDILQGNA